MAYFSRTNLRLKETGQTVTVPDDPKARLMYYLSCMCTVLEMGDHPEINRLRRYRDYDTLSQSDTSKLISLCILLKPDVLLNKCIFQDDRLCGDSANKFFEIEAVRHNMLVAGSVLIGGQRKQVTKIMAFTMSWLKKNWSDPIQALLERQRQQRPAALRRREADESCAIM